MGDSKEYVAMLNKRPQLSLGFQRNMVELATALNNEGLIDDKCYQMVTKAASMYSDSEKADGMVKMLVDRVKFSKKYFHRLLAVLSKSRFHEELVDMLEEEYSQQGGQVVSAGSVGGGLQSKAESMAAESTENRKKTLSWNDPIKMSDLIVIKYKSLNSGETQEIRILTDLAPEWKMAADLLDFDPQRVSAIENPGSGRTPADCLRMVVTEWLKRGGTNSFPTTWKGMHGLLIDCQLGRSARELKEAIESSSAGELGKVSGSPDSAKPPSSAPPSSGSATEKRSEEQPPAPSAAPVTEKRAKMNKTQLAEWLLEQGIDEDDVKIFEEQKVNEMLFLRMKPGDKYMDKVSSVTNDLLPTLQDMLKN